MTSSSLPWVTWFGITFALGCGRIGYDYDFGAEPDANFGAGPDASAGLDARVGGDAGAPDEGIDASPGTRPSLACWSSPMPSAPMALELLNSPLDELDPFLSRDGQRLYFSSGRGQAGLFQVYMSTRTESGDFGEPELYLSDAGGSISHFELSDDELTILMSSDRPGGRGHTDIWLGTRHTRVEPFSRFVLLDNVNSEGNDFDPHFARDTRELWFAPDSLADGMGGQDIALARRTSNAQTFSAPALVPELSSAGNDASPSLSRDGLVVVFASDRDGSRDVWYATREATEQPFGAPQKVPGLDTDDNEREPFLSADGCELFYTAGQQDDLMRVILTPAADAR
jgi:Tol biopolymer transport system component